MTWWLSKIAIAFAFTITGLNVDIYLQNELSPLGVKIHNVYGSDVRQSEHIGLQRYKC
jgi:hypothetical protein